MMQLFHKATSGYFGMNLFRLVQCFFVCRTDLKAPVIPQMLSFLTQCFVGKLGMIVFTNTIMPQSKMSSIDRLWLTLVVALSYSFFQIIFTLFQVIK